MDHLGLREKVLAGEKELGEDGTLENGCFMVTLAQGVTSFTNTCKENRAWWRRRAVLAT